MKPNIKEKIILVWLLISFPLSLFVKKKINKKFSNDQHKTAEKKYHDAGRLTL